MLKHRRLLLSLAVSALIGLTASEARAELISMTITTSSTSISVDLFATIDPLGKTYNVDSTGIATINALLLAAPTPSEYQFVSLAGSSDFPGEASKGQLIVTGEIHAVGTAGSDTFLKITEHEDGFTSPTGASGTLLSSSTGNFTNQPAGAGHTASSSFNATVTPTYSVFSSGVAPNPQGGIASTGVAPVSTLYTLDNTITFGLSKPAATAPDVVDSFGVAATITAHAIPEPASLVMMLMGVPLPLVVLGRLRRRRGAAQG